MLDLDFLRSLGIKDELLPAGPAFKEEPLALSTQALPIAGEEGGPPELLDLSDEYLEEMLEEEFILKKFRHSTSANGSHRPW